MTLHHGMILSTLSISSHGFALGFPKNPHVNEREYLLIIDPGSFPKLANMDFHHSTQEISQHGLSSFNT